MVIKFPQRSFFRLRSCSSLAFIEILQISILLLLVKEWIDFRIVALETNTHKFGIGAKTRTVDILRETIALNRRLCLQIVDMHLRISILLLIEPLYIFNSECNLYSWGMSSGYVVGPSGRHAYVIYAAVFVDHRRKVELFPVERTLGHCLARFGRLKHLKLLKRWHILFWVLFCLFTLLLQPTTR